MAPITTTPFKGEAFPAYVTQRIARKSVSSHEQPEQHVLTSAILGPSATDVQHHRSLQAQPHEQPIYSPSAAAITIRKPQGPSRPPPKTPTRPSLSEQLKTISQGAQCITTQLRATYQLAQSDTRTHYYQQSGGGSHSTAPSSYLLEATTIQLTVGRLSCRFPCPVQFASDHCSYLFQHPFEAIEIQMVMYYRDMRTVQFNSVERSLKFRIARSLDKFGDDYQPGNPQHLLKIVFATASEAQRVKKLLTTLKTEFACATGTYKEAEQRM